MALPELYQEKEYQRNTFDKDAEFKRLYGERASKRDTRKFNKYWNSDQRLADEKAFNEKEDAAEAAFVQDEINKRATSWDARLAALKEQNKARGDEALKRINASLAAKPVVPVSKPDPTPVTKPLTPRSEAEWNRIASEATNGKLKTMEDVKKWQADNGFVGDAIDGKFGKNSLAKWAELNPDKVGAVPVIKPRVVTPKTPVTPTADQTTPLIPEGYVELSRPDGTTFLQRTTPKSDTSATTPTTPTTGFDLDAFRQSQGLKSNAFITHNGKRYLRYDPSDVGDFYIGEDGSMYRAKWGGGVGDLIDHSKYLTYSTPNGTRWERNYNDVYNKIEEFKKAAVKKQGGTMNRINYFQQGGAAPQQDMQQQVIALVQAAMQGDQKATETVNKIMEAAKAGDQQAMQIAQMIQQVAQQMQGQATAAKYGAKLNYLQSLKCGGKTKAKKKEQGGKVCPDCDKQVTKHQYGGSFYSKWSDGDIRKLQMFLSGRKGKDGNIYYKGDYSGAMDKALFDAIKAYQRDNGFTADGMWGYNTNQVHRVLDSDILKKGSYKPTHKTEQGSLRTYDVAGKKMKENDYYKAINNLKEQFYANPEAFWNAGGDIAKWREHLYTTPEGTAIMEAFYGATPDNIKKKLGNRVTNSKMQQAKMNSAITEGTDKVADVAVRKVLPAIALPLSAVAAPLATVTGLAGAAIGGYLGEETWNNLHAGEERYNYLTTDDMGNTAVVVRDPEQERRLQGQVVGAAIGGAAAAEGSQYLGKPGTRGMAGYRRTNNSQSAKTYRSQKRGTTGRFGKKAYLGDAETLDAQMRLGDGTYGYKHVPATPEYQAYLEGAGGNPSYTVVPIGMKNGGNFPRKKYFI